MIYPCCRKTPAITLTNKLNPAYKFKVCDKHKTDPDFAVGFDIEDIK